MRSTILRPLVLAAVSLVTAGAALLAPTAVVAAPADFTGVVVAPDGTPVPDVFVSDEAVGAAQNTDANGRFDVPNAGYDHAYLCARLAQDDGRGGVAGWYDACATVLPGVDATLRFRPGAAVGGVVIDVRTSRPLAGALVGVLDNNDNHGAVVTTDAHGYYRYRNLRPGTGYPVPGTATKVTAAAPHGYEGVRPAPTGVVLRPGQVRNDLGFGVAPVVRFSGTVVGPSGAPVPGAWVGVRTYDDFGGLVLADAHGAWEHPASLVGTADVCAYANGTTAHPTGLAAVCRVGTAGGTDVERQLTLSAEGGALAGSVNYLGVAPRGPATVSVDVPLVGHRGSFPVQAVRKGTTLTAYGLPAGTYQARATATTRDYRTVVGYGRPIAVTPSATSTFPTITLSTG